MKKITKIFALAACVGTLALSSCIEETVQTDQVTEDQVTGNSNGAEALAWAMPAFLNNLGTYDSDYAYDWGYGSIMHIRDVMTADQAVTSSGYNWYTQWSENNYMGKRYVAAYFLWAFYFKAIKTANSTIEALKGKDDASSMGFLATGYAYRALFYLDAARMYEFMPNEKFKVNDDGNNVDYLTLPIVNETTTTEQAQNNPRATHEQMFSFIESDLLIADSLMKVSEFKPSEKTLPSRACVQGLLARLYLWNASFMEEATSAGKRTYSAADIDKMYENAADAADKAITYAENGGLAVLTKSRWLDTKSGFNDISDASWMWGAKASADDDVVQTGILNWTSWMSNEATFGYAAAGPYVCVASALYKKMKPDDFRKLSFKAPSGTSLSGEEPIVCTNVNDEDNYMFAYLPTYASLKFRPGEGNCSEYKVGAACDYPLMRLEEMYFILLEANAHADAATAIKQLTSFMQNFRYSSYAPTSGANASTEAAVNEIILQKRIEFWGEGLTYFDVKRLNMSVDRTTSSNFAESENYITNGRPAWMNLCIPINEENSNKGLKGYNNPDPSDCYKPIKK